MNDSSDIEFSGKKRTECISLWISEDDKALYNLLKNDYDVDVTKEMRKAVTTRLHFLRDKVIKPLAG